MGPNPLYYLARGFASHISNVIILKQADVQRSESGSYIMSNPVHKRKFFSFISHAHADKGIVDQIESWLTKKAGLPVWYDSRYLPSGAKIASELGKAIEDCRSTILVLSKRSVESGWVKEEYDASVDQRASSKDAFKIIPLLIEECEVPSFLKNILQSSGIDISKTGFNLDAASDLLLALYSVDLDLELERYRDIYVSRSWHEFPESEPLLANAVCEVAAEFGFRLVGDSPDQQGFDKNTRVKDIISSCSGLIAILPDRGGGKTSKYILQEIEIAIAVNLPYLIVAEDTVGIPEVLSEKAIEVVRLKKSDLDDKVNFSNRLSPAISSLKEQWQTPPNPHYIFYGTDFDEKHKQRIELICELIRRVSAMPCLIGEDIRQGQIQQEIKNRIMGAFMMLADITEDNLNTCIEAGIALGARRPLHLVACGTRHRPPFMFQDQQVWYYDNDVDLLGIMHNLVRPYRRRIINYELQKSLYH
jgi:hypothetical protein